MIKGAIIGFGISILCLIVPIVHFVLGPIGPFIGGMVGGSVVRANPLQAAGIGGLMGLLMAGPSIALAIISRSFINYLPVWLEHMLVFIAAAIVAWAAILGTAGALLGGRSANQANMRRNR